MNWKHDKETDQYYLGRLNMKSTRIVVGERKIKDFILFHPKVPILRFRKLEAAKQMVVLLNTELSKYDK